MYVCMYDNTFRFEKNIFYSISDFLLHSLNVIEFFSNLRFIKKKRIKTRHNLQEP